MRTIYILGAVLMFALYCSCHKDAKTNGNSCSLSKHVICTVNNKIINANNNVYTSVGACPMPCPIITIQASVGIAPHDTTIHLLISATSTGTYYLGKWGGKRDSTHMWSGEASYIISHGPSVREGYLTDSLYNGTMTITKFDKENKEIIGTFSFAGRRDTITLQVTNGSFEVCY